MTSDDSLLLILRRLDEIERKLDHMLEELRTPTAIAIQVGWWRCCCRHSNLTNNLFASCDKRRPGDGFSRRRMSMNDNDGALAVIIIGQWMTVLILALILWRIW